MNGLEVFEKGYIARLTIPTDPIGATRRQVLEHSARTAVSAGHLAGMNRTHISKLYRTRSGCHDAAPSLFTVISAGTGLSSCLDETLRPSGGR